MKATRYQITAHRQSYPDGNVRFWIWAKNQDEARREANQRLLSRFGELPRLTEVLRDPEAVRP